MPGLGPRVGQPFLEIDPDDFAARAVKSLRLTGEEAGPVRERVAYALVCARAGLRTANQLGAQGQPDARSYYIAAHPFAVGSGGETMTVFRDQVGVKAMVALSNALGVPSVTMLAAEVPGSPVMACLARTSFPGVCLATEIVPAGSGLGKTPDRTNYELRHSLLVMNGPYAQGLLLAVENNRRGLI
jgi:hypothetical protein